MLKLETWSKLKNSTLSCNKTVEIIFVEKKRKENTLLLHLLPFLASLVLLLSKFSE